MLPMILPYIQLQISLNYKEQRKYTNQKMSNDTQIAPNVQKALFSKYMYVRLEPITW